MCARIQRYHETEVERVCHGHKGGWGDRKGRKVEALDNFNFIHHYHIHIRDHIIPLNTTIITEQQFKRNQNTTFFISK